MGSGCLLNSLPRFMRAPYFDIVIIVLITINLMDNNYYLGTNLLYNWGSLPLSYISVYTALFSKIIRIRIHDNL